MPKQQKTRASVASQLVIDMPPAALLAPAAKVAAEAKLTKKQREFARHIVEGETGADAYRKAYDTAGKPNIVKREASLLKKNPNVAKTIEALQKAKELADSLSAAQIRALILSDLVKHSQDEDARLADRLTAVKLLGQLTDVAAFTERKEVLNIKASADIKGQLLEKLKFIGAGSTPEAHSQKPADTSDDADSLLRELRDDPDVIDGELIERGEDFPELTAQSSELRADSDKLEDNSEQGQ